MNNFAMAAFAPHIGKLDGTINKHRVFKTNVQTIIEATIGRQQKAVEAAEVPLRAFRAVTDTPFQRAACALTPVNPLAGRV
jgi:hypothetical protein